MEKIGKDTAEGEEETPVTHMGFGRWDSSDDGIEGDVGALVVLCRDDGKGKEVRRSPCDDDDT